MPPLNPLTKTCLATTATISKPKRPLMRPSLLALAVSQVLSMPPLHAAEITVDDNCTLNEAIISANNDTANGNGCEAGSGDDTIQLSANATITFTEGFSGNPDDYTATPVITSTIIIEGNGSIIERSISATTPFRLLSVLANEDHNGDLTLNNLTVQNGDLLANNGFGGGINVTNGELSLNDVTITGNSARYGGGISAGTSGSVSLSDSTIEGNFSNAVGGGISISSGSLNLSNSAIRGNAAYFSGGGIRSHSSSVSLNNSAVSDNLATVFEGGGIYARSSTIGLNNSTISGNSARTGGGGVDAISDNTISLSSSTISGNTVTGTGGGMNLLFGSSASVNNSTISDNAAAYGGGIRASFSSSVSLSNSTISGNSAWRGAAGIHASRGDSAFTLSNSIVANALGGGPDCYYSPYDPSDPADAVIADQHNIIEDGSCATTALAVDPGLRPLQANGGSTLTHALLAGSPARGRAKISDCPNEDQRGQPRDTSGFLLPIVAKNKNIAVVTFDGDCDIGAVEFQAGD